MKNSRWDKGDIQFGCDIGKFGIDGAINQIEKMIIFDKVLNQDKDIRQQLDELRPLYRISKKYNRVDIYYKKATNSFVKLSPL